MPWLARMLPDTSTPERSGKIAAWIVASKDLEGLSGVIFSFDGKPSRNVWDKVFDSEIGRSVMNDSMELLNTLR